MVNSGPPRGGRRPGATATRDAILAAAREAFFARSYEGATIRGIAAAAGVDPALVIHYFANKRGLFVAAMELPVNPGEVVGAAMRAPRAERGFALAKAALAAWESPGASEVIVALMRSAASDEAATAVLRDFFAAEVLAPIANAGGGGPEAMLRASLAVSHLMGVLFARFIVRIGPLAGTDTATLAPLLGAALQTYLDGDAPEVQS